VKKKETAPDGSKDENVFDIQQGVAIGLFVKQKNKPGPARVYHTDLWGLREGKYLALSELDINTIEWKELKPQSPFYFFVLRNEELSAEYEQGWKVTDIFPVNSVGIVTARDNLTIRWSKQEVWDTVTDFSSLPPEEARDKYRLGKDVRDWKVALAQKDVQTSGLSSEKVVPILYRPFDVRHTYYTGHSRGFICMPRPEVMRHMLTGRNMGLVLPRRVEVVGPWMHALVTRLIPDHVAVSLKTIDSLFPLYLYPSEQEVASGLYKPNERRPNLNPDFIKAVSEKLGLEFVEDGKGDLKATFGPEDIFNYAYAVFHSPTYRSRYAEFLKIDFPRLPLTSDKKLFKALADKGSEVVALHLMESPMLNNLITKYPVSGSNLVENVRYSESEQRVYINKQQYFEGIPPEVWAFQIGGYQVCHKWLKDRKGRTLSYDDLHHYQRIVVAIKETIRLMSEIDSIIPSWPIQ